MIGDEIANKLMERDLVSLVRHQAPHHSVSRTRMKKPSTIEFDGRNGDYVIDGVSLLQHLSRHESIAANDYQVAIGCQTDVVRRLGGAMPPDLQGQWIAIYLCGMCGGYDGNPIGMRLKRNDDYVMWSEIGFYSDHEEGNAIPFGKVRQYVFDPGAYGAFLAHADRYEYRG